MYLKLKLYKYRANALIFYLFKIFNINIILFFLLLQTILNEVLNECDRETPIKLKNDSCVMKYCTKDEYKSEECILDNPIIKAQFPNNIIIFGDFSFRYLNFLQFSNGDMIFETSPFPAYPSTNKRIFYGLKNNGRYYFKKNDSNEETPFKNLTFENKNESKFESGNSIIIIDGIEYFLSMGRMNSYTEIFDFENNKIISNKTQDLIGYYTYNRRPNLLKINKERNKYIFNCISSIENINTAIILKFDLELKEDGISFSNYNTTKMEHSFLDIASCFITEKNEILICFYGYDNSSYIGYLFISYNNELEELRREYFTPLDINYAAFFYSIFFRENAGVFIYYKYESNEYYPNIFFKEYDVEDDSFKDYFLDNNLVVLNKYAFNTDYLANDIIKISENKIGFFTSSKDLEILFIVILNIFNINNINNIKIRYYSIEIYKLLNYKISEDIKGFIFNDFIILGTSYCLLGGCDILTWDKYKSTIMMIGYPNKADDKFYIIDYLILDNNNSIENITLDLSENMIIDNNIFGYIYDGIKIKNIESNGYIYLVSSTSNNIINNETHNELDKNEKIKIEFENNIYNKSEYKLEYSYIVTEPEYEEFEKYPINSSTKYGNDNEEIFNSQKHKYIGKLIYFYIILSEDLTINCRNLSCALCFESNISCITYRPYSEIITEFKESDNTETPTDELKTEINDYIQTETNEYIQTELLNNKSGDHKCSNQDIFENKCQSEIINDEQINYCYNRLKNESIISNNTKIVIKTLNVLFQLLTLDNKKNEEDKDISNIDLGKCFEILKESIDNPLKILKIDIKNADLTSTYVQYEIFDSKIGNKINLNICHDLIIKINVPKKLDDETLFIFYNLENSGYNILDKNDSFYNDICATYTSKQGKDVLLYDRYNDIYIHINEMHICQIDCELISYNTTTENAECDCKIQEEEIMTNLEDITFNKEVIISGFVGSLTNSNFMVLKCYKLLLDFSKLILNYGFIIMSIILLSDFILILIYIIRRNKIIEIIKYFLKIKFKVNEENINQERNKIIKHNNCVKTSIINKEIKQKRNKINNKSLTKEKIENKNIQNKKRKKKEEKKNNFPPKKKKNIKYININNNIYNINFKNNNSSSFIESQFTKKSLINKNIKNIFNNQNICSESLKSPKRNKGKNNNYKKRNEKNMKSFSHNLNDQEMNSLEYNQAIKIDKRTYLKYYCSLLKRKQLLLFAFFPNNDYNLVELKISLLFLSFSLYFTINGFFFSDATMHKIYKDKSSYNIIYQIPIMLYSTFISSSLNIMLRQLSLSENTILSIAQTKDYKNAVKKSKKVLKCLRIKFLLFFLLRIIILLFCWYYISCFCAVYINTQVALICDTFISYGLSMIYPFGLNLLPGIFRFPALKAKSKDKKCLYKISNIISLI